MRGTGSENDEERASREAREQAALDAEVTLELPGEIRMFFRLIPATGAEGFWMGARGYRAEEEPVHRVRLGAFYLGTFPVTQAQFSAWTGTRHYETWFGEHREIIKETSWNTGAEPHKNYFADQANCPAEQVTWWEAEGFGRWLMAEGDTTGKIPKGHAAGLPTEAQWEWACRAGTETEYWSGDGETALAKVGWYDGNSENRTHAVGLKGENGRGLYDMHGNVWEWCRDAWNAHAYRKRADGVADPCEPGEKRSACVLRGGSWLGSAVLCRAAYRYGGRPGGRIGNFGFRVCLFPGSGGLTSPELRRDAAAGGEAGGGAGSDGTEREAEERGGADLAKEKMPRSGRNFLE